MPPLSQQLIILLSTPVYALIIGIEIIASNYQVRKGTNRKYTTKNILTNLFLSLLNASLDIALRGFIFMVLGTCYLYRLYHADPTPIYWLSLLIAEDFLFYWLHRFDHQVRLFWAVHVTHHSSELMNLTVGFRSSVFQPLYRFIYFIPLTFVGFRPEDIMVMYSATQIWGILVHTEMVRKLGWLEYILVTPSHHRVHHASNNLYLDKNLGMFLITWDKLFGTFQAELEPEEYQPIRYGLTKPLDNDGIVNTVFHEWAAITKDLKRGDLSFRDKVNYVFGPPGWSHDGSTKTSEQLRLEEQVAVAAEN
ncbi:MAG TPA: sterol desaturase family protein [Flavitalea sp.]|nr:sterol desaturase family protein [Flavitalea sp.]